MTLPIPHLALSHGQVLWCLAGGEEPNDLLISRVRYLRQLGIPFADGKTGGGRGVRVTYDFDQFLELAVAWQALRQRLEPRLLKKISEARRTIRTQLRKAYRELAEHPENFEGNPRVRSVFDPEIYLCFADRFSEDPGAIQFKEPEESKDYRVGDLVHKSNDGSEGIAIPLKSLVSWQISLAKVAPPTRPGPKY